MATKFDLVPMVAPVSVHQSMLEEQKSEAREIKCKFGSLEAMQTAQDYFEEMYPEYKDTDISKLFLTPTAVTGKAGATSTQTGEATEALRKIKKERGGADDSNFKNLTSWLEYLTEVVTLREAGHTLVQWEDGLLIGFVDHETSTLIRISMSDIRACRRDAKADSELMDRYRALAPKLGLEAEEVLTSSRTPATRAFILGPCEYGIQSDQEDLSDVPLILVAGVEEATAVESEEIPNLEDLWDSDSAGRGGSFLHAVPSLGDEDRTAPVVDERL